MLAPQRNPPTATSVANRIGHRNPALAVGARSAGKSSFQAVLGRVRQLDAELQVAGTVSLAA